jgi:multidrug transporter EmrE-like cation transporter
MNYKINKWIIIIILVIIEIIAQYSLNYSSIHKEALYKYLGMLLYSLSGYYYYELLIITDDLGSANVLWTCGTFIGVTLLAVMLNKEKLSLRKIIASILIVIALILYEY